MTKTDIKVTNMILIIGTSTNLATTTIVLAIILVVIAITTTTIKVPETCALFVKSYNIVLRSILKRNKGKFKDKLNR